MRKNRTNTFYGWVIVLVGIFSMFFSSPGQTFSVSIFIDYYIELFGWSRSQISAFYSMATLVSGLSMPFIGDIIDKQGYRKSISAVSLLFGVALIWMSGVQTPGMILIGFLFIRMFGQGALTLIPNILIPQWFHRKRGRALAFISFGMILGSTIVPPLNHYLITNFGLSRTWLVWAALMFFIMLPVGAIFTRNNPEDIGQLPDGEGFKETDKDSGEKTQTADREESWTLNEARQTRTFWLMIYATLVPPLITTAITFHLVSVITDKGQDAAFAAYLLSIMSLVQIGATFIAGFLLEKVPVYLVKAWNYLLFVAALFLLIYTREPAYLILYGVFHGVFMAIDNVSTNVLWPEYYGRLHLGKIRGVATSAVVIGSSLGPLPFGIAYDLFGGYTEILFLSLILPVLASWACFISPAPVKQISEQSK